MLNVQSVSVNQRPSFASRESLSEEEIENRRYERERKFYEGQERELRLIAEDKAAPGPIGKFAKVLLRITGATLAGVGMALASNMSFNVLGKMIKHIKLDKAASWTGKKIGSMFKFGAKQFQKLGKKAAETKTANTISNKAIKISERFKSTKFVAKLNKALNWAKDQKSYKTVAKKVSKFNDKAIDWVSGITGKKVQTAVANTLGVASGLTVLVSAKGRGRE